FYPDLPKGYQISQYELPICIGGQIEILVDGDTRKIGLPRIHMEEDTGKNIHNAHGASSLVGFKPPYAPGVSSLADFNRSCGPALEIVGEPDMRTVEEAGAYLRTLRSILQYL